MKLRLAVASFPVLLALVAVAGCGGGGGSASAASGGSPSGGSARAATVGVANNSQLGNILVDSQGNTLYTFQKDTGSRSSCAGRCAQIWPPLVASGTPKAGNGANAAMVGAIKRSDGSMQVTYAGHPLYTYTADGGPGQATGNGINTFGAVWNAIQPSGAKAPSGTGSSGGGASSASSSGGASGSTSSGGSYGY